MSVKIEIYNESALRRVPRNAMLAAMQRACAGEELHDGVIRVILLDDGAIHDLNRRFLQHDYPTDVITFTLEEQPLEGEIYIGTGVAAAQATQYGVSLTNEISRLVVHGVLHLAGHDDATPELRAAMNSRETHYLGTSQN